LRFPEPEEGLKKDEVAGAADGQKLREPLNDTQEDGLWDVDTNTPLRMSNVKV